MKNLGTLPAIPCDSEEEKRQKKDPPSSVWNYVRKLIELQSGIRALTEGTMDLKYTAPGVIEICGEPWMANAYWLLLIFLNVK